MTLPRGGGHGKVPPLGLPGIPELKEQNAPVVHLAGAAPSCPKCAASHAMAWIGSALGDPRVPLGVDEVGQSGSVPTCTSSTT